MVRQRLDPALFNSLTGELIGWRWKLVCPDCGSETSYGWAHSLWPTYPSCGTDIPLPDPSDEAAPDYA